ncbi:MAG: hypothetical protein J6C64_12540 [Lachnospiraceae bacterium]|nr:hypothetical protein [Lachnospiraceae bacterium]
MKVKWFKKRVDERQEMDLLKVEHFGFWFMYWMLFAALIIQGLFMEDGVKRAAGEWIVFMSTSVVVLIGCVRKGVWSFHTRKVPGIKAYLLYSLIASVLAGVPFGILFGLRANGNSLKGIILFIVYYMVLMYIITFAGFLIVGTIARKREAALANQDFEEEDDEEDL